MASTSSSQSLSQEIDRLLEHYLSLLSQYDALRTELSGVQASVRSPPLTPPPSVSRIPTPVIPPPLPTTKLKLYGKELY
jgi:hypothetical protein